LNIELGSVNINQTFQKSLDKSIKNNVSSYYNAHFLFFETLNNVDQNMRNIQKTIKWPPRLLFVNNVLGIDLLVSKSSFATIMNERSDSKSVIPLTYVIDQNINSDNTISNLKMQNDIFYILKKNMQRQNGFYISNDTNDIIKNIQIDKQFVVCQEMLQNPFTIKAHKINLRIYLLVIIRPTCLKTNKNVSEWYAFTDGFLYYTPKPFKRNSTNKDEIITSGYVDRTMYDDKPMTLLELKGFMGSSNTYIFLYDNIIKALRSVKANYDEMYKGLNIKIPGTKFSLYGCDFAPDEQLSVKIMEINKGPDISYKDERDKKVKSNLIDNMMNVLLYPKKNQCNNENTKKREFNIGMFIQI
jgi:hypothetical protein